MVTRGTFAVAGGCLLVISLMAAVYSKRRRKRRLGWEEVTDWKEVGSLSEIYLYPVKSGQPVILSEAEATPFGLAENPIHSSDPHDQILVLRDRFLVVYDKDTGEFLNAKKLPALMRLHVQAAGTNSVELSFPDMGSYKVELPKFETKNGVKEIFVEMYEREKIPSLDCGKEVGEWLTKTLQGTAASQPPKLQLGLGSWPQRAHWRRDFTTSKYSKLYQKLRKEDSGAYSDMSAFMMMNSASLADLKAKVGSGEEGGVPPPVNTLQFRPNLVVSGSSPFEEDTWDWIRIGKTAVFRNFKPCTRCSITTMDPETGLRHPQLEPLTTLKKYRQLADPALRKLEGSSPMMGIYIGLYQTGIIKVGDPVYVA